MAQAKLKIVPKEVSPSDKGDRLSLGQFNSFLNSGNFTLFILVVVTINILILSSLFYYHNKLSVRVIELSTRAKSLSEQSKKQILKEKKTLNEKTVPIEIVDLTLFPMDAFLVSITSEQGPKYLQLQMELELSDPQLEDEVTRAKAGIRDAIIVLVSSKSYRELQDPSSMKKIKSALLDTINTLLKTGKVKHIYFTKFHFN